MPQLKNYYEAYRDRGFDVVSISLDEEREKLDEFMELLQQDLRDIPASSAVGIFALGILLGRFLSK